MPTERDFNELKEKQQSLCERARRLEQALRTVNGTAFLELLESIRKEVGRLQGEGARCPQSFVTLLQRIDQLSVYKEHLSDGLIRRVWLAIKDSQERLAEDSTNCYALKQLAYVETVLARALDEVS